ncbi:phage holin family protein [Geobacter sp. SVR]|uniref:phage holin family protein n=1 Tax=Geobacter sp. SVR TaxID=2495594 RepID=UPI00143EF8E8|nr:phage holin family protein [Geobacter sp. SVR]BCS54821.1 hypothetical protein GSVR_31290 [Geobacter sp. SVR]GCF86371.1 hypothetical protein GSbR_29710 [Geobacter sp. SVR]
MPNETLGELLGQLATKSATLMRDEIELAKQEARESLTAVAGGSLLIAIGAVVGFCAFLILCLAVVFALASRMPPGVAALVTGLALALAGGLLAVAGVARLKKTSLKPRKTIQTLKEGKQWLKERV